MLSTGLNLMIPVEGKKQLVTTVSSLEQCASKRKHHRDPY